MKYDETMNENDENSIYFCCYYERVFYIVFEQCEKLIIKV